MAKQSESKPVLCINSSSDWRIVDDKTQQQYTLEEAKELHATNKIWEGNLAFTRLVSFNFDLEALKKFYDEEVKS